MTDGVHIQGLTVRIPLTRDAVVHPVTDVDLVAPAGEITALVGESGCGKSVIASAIMGMLPSGATHTGSVTIRNNGTELDVFNPQRRFRGSNIGLIPQSAAMFFTPVRTARSQLKETIAAHHGTTTADDLAVQVGLKPSDLDRYPHQLSGGMAHRVAVAAALAGQPTVIVADEPTASLDSGLSDHILYLLRRCADSGAAIVLITHDLDSLLRTSVADNLAVMYASRLMETGPAYAVLTSPLHDYTRDLLRALPSGGMHPLPGQPPTLVNLLDECVYYLRRPETTQSGGPTAVRRLGLRSYRTRQESTPP